VLVHGRNPERVAAVAKDIAELSPNSRIEPYLADFSSLDDVRALADDIRKQHKKLDVLINNAGIGRGPDGGKTREVSVDGHGCASRSIISRRSCCSICCCRC